MTATTPPKPGVHVNLKLSGELHGKVRALAQSRYTTVNNQIRVMILDWLERTALRSLDQVRDDLEISWARFSERFLRLELEDQIIDALADAQSLEDLARIKTLARAAQALRRNRERREQEHLAKQVRK